MAFIRILFLFASLFSCGSTFSFEISPSGFLCSFESDGEQGKFASYISANGSKKRDGSIHIPGPVNHHGLCIRDISIVGSFGVVMATGSSCKANADNFVLSLEKHLKLSGSKGRTAEEPIATFELPNEARQKGRLIVYRGEPSLEAKQIATARKVSYVCVRQAGGAQ
jgi:hypothetical protein